MAPERLLYSAPNPTEIGREAGWDPLAHVQQGKGIPGSSPGSPLPALRAPPLWFGDPMPHIPRGATERGQVLQLTWS